MYIPHWSRLRAGAIAILLNNAIENYIYIFDRLSRDAGIFFCARCRVSSTDHAQRYTRLTRQPTQALRGSYAPYARRLI